jgi:hypothetical protein
MGALVALGVALLANSGPEPPPEQPPLEIGAMTEAPPTALNIQLVVPFGQEFVSFGSWPQACDLLTDDEIRSVLPQTEQVLREPDGETFESMDLGGPGATTTIASAPGVNCLYELDMPNAGLGLNDPRGPASVTLRVYAAGSPNFVELNYDRLEEPFEIAGGVCSAGTTYGLSCHNESVAFTVQLDASHPDLDAEDQHTLETSFAQRILAKLPAATPGPP